MNAVELPWSSRRPTDLSFARHVPMLRGSRPTLPQDCGGGAATRATGSPFSPVNTPARQSCKWPSAGWRGGRNAVADASRPLQRGQLESGNGTIDCLTPEILVVPIFAAACLKWKDAGQRRHAANGRIRSTGGRWDSSFFQSANGEINGATSVIAASRLWHPLGAPRNSLRRCGCV